MKFSSLIKKAVNLVRVNFLNPDHFISRSLYLNMMYKEDFKYVKKILFYFDNNEYMHLGDHLFFVPLIAAFQASGYDIEILPTKIMQPFFEKLGFKIGNKNFNYESYDLIISRIEMIAELIEYKAILVHVSKKLTMPICDHMLNEFSKFFYLKTDVTVNYSIFADSEIRARLGLSNKRQLVLFNLYCDAAAYLVTRFKRKLILDKLSEYNDLDKYQIVFVGSSTDKLNDQNTYNFDYLDLRGLTTVNDIFALANLDNAFCYIGFDAFVMHVFSLLHKKSYVVFRGRLSRRQHELLKKFHVNLFTNDNYVTLLND